MFFLRHSVQTLIRNNCARSQVSTVKSNCSSFYNLIAVTQYQHNSIINATQCDLYSITFNVDYDTNGKTHKHVISDYFAHFLQIL